VGRISETANQDGETTMDDVTMKPGKTKLSDTFERKVFTTSRLAEFASIPELEKQTGQPVANWLLVIVKELCDNALDEMEEASVAPFIEIAVDGATISVADQGRGIKPAMVKALTDYSAKQSSRAAVVAPTRGQQGNALHSIIAMGYLLANGGDAGADSPAVLIESKGVAHTLRFAIDPVRRTPVVSHDTAPSEVKIGSRVTVRWPEQARPLIDKLWSEAYSLVEAYAWLNPHLALDVKWSAGVGEDARSRHWKWEATDTAWAKWLPSMPSSAHWYDVERLNSQMANEIAYAQDHHTPCPTVRDFVSQFRGLKGTQTLAGIRDALGVAERETLAEFFERDNAAAQLLKAMLGLSRPVKLGDLGLIGEAHLRDRLIEDGCAANSIAYRKAEIVHGGAPYVIEVGFGFRPDSQYGRDVIEGFNFAPAIGDSPFQLEQRLASLDVDADDPVTVFAHLTAPRLSFADKGKAKFNLPDTVGGKLSEMVTAVTKAWTKQKLAEIRHNDAMARRVERMTRPTRNWTIKEAAYEVMEASYLLMSEPADGGPDRLPVRPRQIMYAARPSILRTTGKQEFDDGYFTQNVLVEYMIDHPDETVSWDIIWDDRGHIQEPHTGRLIGLGTLAVRSYIGAFHDPVAESASISAAHVKTFGPAGRYGGVLFNEKEGFEPIFQAMRLYQRYDIAPMSTKGMSTTAGRAIVEELCGKRGLPLFVLHDLDKSGFSIMQTLTNDTKRYGFAYPLQNVIEIGLRLPAVTRLGLASEAFQFRKNENLDNTADRLRTNGAMEDEIDFLLSPAPGHTTGGQRVELNAMTSAQLIGLVEDTLKANGVGKVMPSPGLLAETYTAFKRSAAAQASLEAELARLNAQPVKVPANLDKRVRAHLKRHPHVTWDDAVRALLSGR
jgi:DNA topoisomerase VI subunit B